MQAGRLARGSLRVRRATPQRFFQSLGARRSGGIGNRLADLRLNGRDTRGEAVDGGSVGLRARTQVESEASPASSRRQSPARRQPHRRAGRRSRAKQAGVAAPQPRLRNGSSAPRASALPRPRALAAARCSARQPRHYLCLARHFGRLEIDGRRGALRPLRYRAAILCLRACHRPSLRFPQTFRCRNLAESGCVRA